MNYNEEESMHGTNLEAEYDATFDGADKVSNLLSLSSDAFTLSSQKIKISEIGFTEPVKRGRANTITGLTSIVKDLGVLVPIHVMLVPEESQSDDYKYIVLDGVRRIFGAMRNGELEINAVVWDFDDKDKGFDLALFISLILNRVERRSMAEVWSLYQILEMQTSITPGTLEYLLQLQSGDAMKLKDVMLCDYDEVKQALINGEKDLEGAYKLLQKLRKEEDRLAKEDATGVEDTVEGAEDIKSTSAPTNNLSEQDVLELLEMADSVSDVNLDSADFNEMNQSEFDDVVQKVGERHPVSKEVRQGTFIRDDYRCRCCNTGGVAFLASLIYHHTIPVHCGGADTVDNGLTLCDTCHLTLHCCEKNGGRIPMTESQFNEYDEKEKKRIKYIIKYAKVAVEASKRKGISQDKIKEEANKSARHRMPGEGLTENMEGFNNFSRGAV